MDELNKKMKEWELTPEDIEAIETPSEEVMLTNPLWWDMLVGQVAQRKLVKWLADKGFEVEISDCSNRLHSNYAIPYEDWQTLRRAVGLE